MSEATIHRKLVRDRIPDIIREAGKTPVCVAVPAEDRLEFLKLKLLEECRELLAAPDAARFAEEAGDILAVLRAMTIEQGVSWEAIEEACRLKQSARGGFERGVYLYAVIPGDSAASSLPPDHPPRPVVPELITPDSEHSLVDTIRRELAESRECRMASAFLTRSTLNILSRAFDRFVADGGRLRILTSAMNGFNDPDDLLHVSRRHPNVEVRVFWPGTGDTRFLEPPRSFHLKCFLFRRRDGGHSMVVGSSNLTSGGLGQNIEWNYFSNLEANTRLPFGEASPYASAAGAFDRYWQDDSVGLSDEFLDAYRPLHRDNSLARRLLEHEPSGRPDHGSPVPKPAQREALRALAARRRLGVERTVVIAATGVGKTFLSAFDFAATGYESVLFVVHRETILRQARATYRRVLSREDFGCLLTGNATAAERVAARAARSSVFATVQTLSRPDVLAGYACRHFDYVVIDEFHHGAAESYRRIIGHFRPRFMLGLTATPERMDGRDVLQLCDYDVAYESRLFDAIDQGRLAPFQYFALYDETDYSRVRWTGIGYDEAELERELNRDTRAELIIRNLRRYLPSRGKTKALAFCASKGHARYMDRQFREAGVPSVCLLGEDTIEDRTAAIRRLQDEKEDLQVICSVDVFAEGIDIPAVSHVLLLRPTQSITVFLQQIGRGLRQFPGKEFVVILDFVGNFRNSYVVPLALHGVHAPAQWDRTRPIGRFRCPAACSVDVDAGVLRIWDKELRRALAPANLEERLRDTYREMRRNLDHSPDILDFFANPEACDPHAFVKRFGSWLETKQAMDDLPEGEGRLLGTPGAAFLAHIEKELRSVKSYKMVVLLGLLDTSPDCTEWAVQSLAESFLQHYLRHREQLPDYTALARFAEHSDPCTYPLSRVVALICSMPLKFLAKGPDDFFELDKAAGLFRLKAAVHQFWPEAEFRRLVRDRVLYALKRYFYRRGPTADPGEDRDPPKPISGSPVPSTPSPEESETSESEPGFTLLPYFPSLELACGVFREGEAEPEQAGIEVTDPGGRLSRERHFVAVAEGDSMDGSPAPVKDGQLLLLEWIRPDTAGSLSGGGRSIAVEYRDETGGLAYALKKVRKDGPGRYRLVSDNTAYPPIPVDPETMFPFARLVRALTPDDIRGPEPATR